VNASEHADGSVVVGLDGSPGSAHALRWAVREGRLHGSPVTAVTAWGIGDRQELDGDPNSFDSTASERHARAALDRYVEDAVGPDAAEHIARRAICGLPSSVLLGAAAGASLLVLGARGRGGFRGLLLGSVSQQCLHHTTTPLAIIHDQPVVRRDVEHVLVAVDGSRSSELALRWALDEGRRRAAVVTVLHATSPPIAGGYPYTARTFDPGERERDARRMVDDMLEGEDTHGLDLRPLVVDGAPTPVILGRAQEADLLVAGTRGVGGFKGMLVGSVTGQLAHHAPCPLVVIPDPR
jgi:nucleotide-binding universal stress UspA family protein